MSTGQLTAEQVQKAMAVLNAANVPKSRRVTRQLALRCEHGVFYLPKDAGHGCCQRAIDLLLARRMRR